MKRPLGYRWPRGATSAILTGLWMGLAFVAGYVLFGGRPQ